MSFAPHCGHFHLSACFYEASGEMTGAGRDTFCLRGRKGRKKSSIENYNDISFESKKYKKCN